MLPLSTQRAIPFTPRRYSQAPRTAAPSAPPADGAIPPPPPAPPVPTFWIVPPSAYGRAEWLRACRAAGVQAVHKSTLRDALRKALRGFLEGDELVAGLRAVDEYEGALEACEELGDADAPAAPVAGAGGDASAAAAAPVAPGTDPAHVPAPVDEEAPAAGEVSIPDAAAPALPAEDTRRLELLIRLADTADLVRRYERQAIRNVPAYAELAALEQFWLDVAPLIATQYFCVRWEHVTAPAATVRALAATAAWPTGVPAPGADVADEAFVPLPFPTTTRTNGIVPFEWCDALPPRDETGPQSADWWQVGLQAMGLGRITTREKKT
jgi:hypothetical protein